MFQNLPNPSRLTPVGAKSAATTTLKSKKKQREMNSCLFVLSLFMFVLIHSLFVLVHSCLFSYSPTYLSSFG